MAPRSDSANRTVREQASHSILDAAAKVFAHRGYSGTKIADIAQEAGVSHGLVHHYFGTKAEIFRVLIEQVDSSAREVPAQALAREGTATENLRWMVAQMLAGTQNAPEYYVLNFQARMSEAAPEEARERVEEYSAEGFGLMTEVIAKAQAEGGVRAGDTAKLLNHVIATIQGLAMMIAFSDEQTRVVPDVDLVLSQLDPRLGAA